MLGKANYMQSLKTTVKREAERLSRSVSVQFDSICHEARLKRELALAGAGLKQTVEDEGLDSSALADELLARIPALMRQAASRVIEEQQRNPRDWLNVVKGWQSFYEAMTAGKVPAEAQRPVIEAQAFLNGIELAIQGKPLPPETVAAGACEEAHPAMMAGESWASVCRRALAKYSDFVGVSRYKVAQRRLPEVRVASVTLSHVESGLLEWCRGRLNDVSPRTVKTQLDCMVAALRGVLPKLQVPRLRELQGVMQPRVGDRQSMPVQAIRAAIRDFENRPVSTKVRRGYGGGASQFDAIAIQTLALLGIRPKELLSATDASLVSKQDFLGVSGLFLRLQDGKNQVSERDIPLSDGSRSIVDTVALRKMLVWQRENGRNIDSARTSLGTRFKKMTNSYTLYQMRHTWKDVAQHSGVDFELRERLMGHKVPGVAAVYGSGIPLKQGLDSLFQIRDVILGKP